MSWKRWIGWFGVVLVVVIAWSPSGVASAACPSGSDANCDDPTGNRVCDVSGSTWLCDTEFSSSADSITAIHDSGGDAYAWGYINSTYFCCIETSNVPDHIQIATLAGDDEISLVYSRDEWEGTSYISAAAGDDQITGSSYESCSFPCDDIYPGNGSDDTYAMNGDDRVTEPLRADGGNWIEGGPGEDTLTGGGSHDYIKGGDDVDDVYGGAGDDDLCGGLGADSIWGGFGNDECEDTADSMNSCDTPSGIDGWCHFP